MACRTVVLSWDIVQPFMINSLELSQPLIPGAALLEGEGPVGCFCIRASACLPHLINYYDGTSSLFGEPASDFFGKLTGAFKLVCFHTTPSIRALSFEHIETIH